MALPDGDTRVGVGIGVFNVRVEQHYQSIFNRAAQGEDAAHFFERLMKDEGQAIVCDYYQGRPGDTYQAGGHR